MSYPYYLAIYMKDDLILTPVPALVAVLLAKEKEKGTSLTKDEVEKIRDQAECIAMPRDLRRQRNLM